MDRPFRRLSGLPDASIEITVDGQKMTGLEDDTLAAVMLLSGIQSFRSKPVSGADGAPYCMMGSCFECLVEIDGVPNQQACMTIIRPGMSVVRQISQCMAQVTSAR